MHARQAKASDMGAEREHHVWNNLVYLLLTQDYLLDNQIKEDWEKGGDRLGGGCDARRENERERRRPKRLKEKDRKNEN